MALIQIRIDDTEKERLKEVLSQLGLNYSSAAKLFFRKVVEEQKIPFEISVTKKENKPEWKPFETHKIG